MGMPLSWTRYAWTNVVVVVLFPSSTLTGVQASNRSSRPTNYVAATGEQSTIQLLGASRTTATAAVPPAAVNSPATTVGGPGGARTFDSVLPQEADKIVTVADTNESLIQIPAELVAKKDGPGSPGKKLEVISSNTSHHFIEQPLSTGHTQRGRSPSLPAGEAEDPERSTPGDVAVTISDCIVCEEQTVDCRVSFSEDQRRGNQHCTSQQGMGFRRLVKGIRLRRASLRLLPSDRFFAVVTLLMTFVGIVSLLSVVYACRGGLEPHTCIIFVLYVGYLHVLGVSASLPSRRILTPGLHGVLTGVSFALCLGLLPFLLRNADKPLLLLLLVPPFLTVISSAHKTLS